MSSYSMDKKKQELYLMICEKGIGWNLPYAKGTMELDGAGKLKLSKNKAKSLYKDIMSKYIAHITIEGGKRGGKDVYALYAWANYLMICPDRLHLATGQTTKHAVQTILEADGFGLAYLLPHGEKIMEDNGIVFRFLDFYGIVKRVMFFAGGEINDAEKFRGYNFGSHYANEAIQQHYNTIKEGATRTNASKWRKVIHTQNPEAGTFEYYDKYEKPLQAKPQDLALLYEKKEYYKKVAREKEQEYRDELRSVEKRVADLMCEKLGYVNQGRIKENIVVYKKYIVLLRDEKEKVSKKWDAIFRQDYANFEEYYDNPNNVRNGLNFRYYHFTHKDNLAMTDLDREKVENTYDKAGVIYRREILGIRASSDNAIWDTFTNKNIIHCEIPSESYCDRFLSVDYGMKNAFVIADCDIDSNSICTIWKEYRFDGRKMEEDGSPYTPPTNTFYVSKIEEMIKSRNKGVCLGVIVDPSATGLINELKLKGISVIKAKNAVGTRANVDVVSNKKVDKSMTGIWLVRDGFARNKIFIHESCRDGISECVGYCFDSKKLAIGIEEPLKINDHFCDCVRYLINTRIKDARRWS
jgi:hypothetical protein